MRTDWCGAGNLLQALLRTTADALCCFDQKDQGMLILRCGHNRLDFFSAVVLLTAVLFYWRKIIPSFFVRIIDFLLY